MNYRKTAPRDGRDLSSAFLKKKKKNLNKTPIPPIGAQTHMATHAHRNTPAENGVTGFHGAMRLTDRAGVLTCSKTTGRMMVGKRKGRREREAERAQ